MPKSYLIMSGVVFAIILSFTFLPPLMASDQSKSHESLSPAIVADYIHAVIQADRILYTTHVVEHMEDHKIVTAQEHWKQTKSLPPPAQMLLLSGLQVMQKGIGLQFRLASLNPIYEKNGPTTDFEKTGLAAVREKPNQPYVGTIQRGNGRFFKAI